MVLKRNRYYLESGPSIIAELVVDPIIKNVGERERDRGIEHATETRNRDNLIEIGSYC